MFNLNQAINEWRQQMAAGGNKDSTILDELESHLREDIRARVLVGDSERHAFDYAVLRIGNPTLVCGEFNKIESAHSLAVKIGVFLWAGAVLLLAVLFTSQLFVGKLSLLLAIYAVTLPAGFGAVYLMGGLAIYYVCCQWFGKLSPALEQSLDRAIRKFTTISLGLILVDFAFLMIWSKQNRGGYWGASLQEIATACVLIWVIALRVMQHFNRRNVHARMLVCIGGNVVVSLSWFGVLILIADPELRHLGSHWLLEILIAVHLVILAMGLSRRLETVKA